MGLGLWGGLRLELSDYVPILVLKRTGCFWLFRFGADRREYGVLVVWVFLEVVSTGGDILFTNRKYNSCGRMVVLWRWHGFRKCVLV